MIFDDFSTFRLVSLVVTCRSCRDLSVLSRLVNFSACCLVVTCQLELVQKRTYLVTLSTGHPFELVWSCDKLRQVVTSRDKKVVGLLMYEDKSKWDRKAVDLKGA